jgi:predicted RNase H-like HicB family nuclease
MPTPSMDFQSLIQGHCYSPVIPAGMPETSVHGWQTLGYDKLAKHLPIVSLELEINMRYPMVIHKETDSDYGVIVPDLPGCFSAGTTLDEAMALARDAIECHIGGLLLDGDPLPLLQLLEIHQANPEYAGGIWYIVEI